MAPATHVIAVSYLTKEVILVGRHSFDGGPGRHCSRAAAAALGPGAVARSAYSPGRLARTAGLLAGAGLVAVMVAPLGADAAALRTPVAHVRLPAAAEDLQPYVAQDSCDPTAKPGVVAFRALMLTTYRRGRDGGIVQSCTVPGLSEHKEGRAWDWMLDSRDPRDRAVATSALTWLLAAGPHGEPAWNARRLGIMYMIWDRRIWGAYRQSEGWRPYVGVSAHTDHIHFSFGWNGAMKRTSWWTGRVAALDYGPCAMGPGMAAAPYHGFSATPCPAYPPVAPVSVYAGPWWTGARVLAIQRTLGITQSAVYGPATADAVALWQRHHHLAATGVEDVHTATAMELLRPAPPGAVYAGPGNTGPHVLTLQRALHVPVTGYYGALTAHAVAVWQGHHHLPASGVVDLRTAVAMRLAPAPVYAGPGNTGPHVLTLQRALHVPVTGHYGALTAHAVALWQRRHHLPPTGVVDLRTARAMRLVR